MSRPAILKPGESYSFSRYFELPFAPGDILVELGYTLMRKALELPHSSVNLDVSNLKRHLERNLLRVELTSETARRETLIAPILLELCDDADASLSIEYPVQVSDYLKGTVDYYITARQTLLIVEAKQADLTRGFTQLSVELIALSQWLQPAQPLLYGAVTTGDIWKFGVLNCPEKQVYQDINLFRVPADLEELLRTLNGILVEA